MKIRCSAGSVCDTKLLFVKYKSPHPPSRPPTWTSCNLRNVSYQKSNSSLHDKSWDQALNLNIAEVWVLLFQPGTRQLSTERASTVEIKNLLSEIDRTVKILARQIKHPHHYIKSINTKRSAIKLIAITSIKLRPSAISQLNCCCWFWTKQLDFDWDQICWVFLCIFEWQQLGQIWFKIRDFICKSEVRRRK